MAYIGFATDDNIRYRATSGGVGTALLKYLFESGKIVNALSFYYDTEKNAYEPCIIYQYDDYVQTGSIYQEINIYKFLKNQLQSGQINGDIAFFCLPCQALAIRKLFEQTGFTTYLLGLTCSSQQSIEATSYLLKRVGLDFSRVINLQYRGNGWPSGVQIKKNNGEMLFVSNNSSLWSDIFHSRLFIQKRCFYCQNTLNKYSDVVLADPWLKDYLSEESIGQTLFAAHSPNGATIIKMAIDNGYIVAKNVNDDFLEKSQRFTLMRKSGYKKHPRVRNILMDIYNNSIYRKFALLPIIFKFHIKLNKIIENKFLK